MKLAHPITDLYHAEDPSAAAPLVPAPRVWWANGTATATVSALLAEASAFSAASTAYESASVLYEEALQAARVEARHAVCLTPEYAATNCMADDEKRDAIRATLLGDAVAKAARSLGMSRPQPPSMSSPVAFVRRNTGAVYAAECALYEAAADPSDAQAADEAEAAVLALRRRCSRDDAGASVSRDLCLLPGCPLSVVTAAGDTGDVARFPGPYRGRGRSLGACSAAHAHELTTAYDKAKRAAAEWLTTSDRVALLVYEVEAAEFASRDSLRRAECAEAAALDATESAAERAVLDASFAEWSFHLGAAFATADALTAPADHGDAAAFDHEAMAHPVDPARYLHR